MEETPTDWATDVKDGRVELRRIKMDGEVVGIGLRIVDTTCGVDAACELTFSQAAGLEAALAYQRRRGR